MLRPVGKTALCCCKTSPTGDRVMLPVDKTALCCCKTSPVGDRVSAAGW